MPHATTTSSGAVRATVASPPRPTIREIAPGDVTAALREGWRDFLAKPSHLFFLALFYPLFGIVLGLAVFSDSGLWLVFPLVAGFAIVGPLAAIPLYEASRRRETGDECTWISCLDALRRPGVTSILIIGLMLAALFVAWIASAQAIFAATWGATPIAGPFAFLGEVLTTPSGWALVIVGHAVGAAFAALAFCIGVVSLPMLVDRDVGAGIALAASFAAVRENKRAMTLWAAIVAALLILGSAPLLVGLTVAMPVLGHATWRLYRRVVDENSVAKTPTRG
ncbi:DUF2189 domain-containing protein [Salinarimonas ramus]|uniref:DUF2189 domain-containing protein n=1 Tax=Salinarimonas ramus TaxID=690164 RepID=A0A917V8N2_9HYPH|nr:DUF2189 domain-containing protein [Salinarimonas ramus]GGK49467.1 hypothetical protein GCM10011322_40600 [Salinarimonas ramus]